MRKYLIILPVFLMFSSVVFAGNPPHQPSSSYGTPSSSAPADGSTTQTVTVRLLDASSNPIVGDTVALSSSNDSTVSFPQNNQVTDSNGKATFTVTSKTVGTTQLTVTDTTSATTFVNWFSIAFTPVPTGSATPTPTPTSCTSAPAPPRLSSVVSSTNYNATLTWVNSADPVTKYIVSYGIEHGKYLYSAQNAGSQGTTSYTVNSLLGNKKYYFVVSASNACGVSSYSNEVAAIVQPITATPLATSTPRVVATPTPTVPTYPTVTPEVSPLTSPSSTPEVTSRSTDDLYINIAMGVLFAGVGILGFLGVKKLRSRRSRIS